jgi:glutaredoxin
MFMKNKIIIPTILFIAVLIFSFFVLLREKNKNQTNETTTTENQSSDQIILFYGDGCPHCAIVEDYINKNKIQEKIPLIQKEVYYNQNNAKDLKAKAKICGLPTDSIGVPFLWDGEKCLIGNQDIINFFKQKLTNGQ